MRRTINGKATEGHACASTSVSAHKLIIQSTECDKKNLDHSMVDVRSKLGKAEQVLLCS